jgi:hypothetical protein
MSRRELLMHQIRGWAGPGSDDERPICGAAAPEFGFLQMTGDLRDTIAAGLTENPCKECLAKLPIRSLRAVDALRSGRPGRPIVDNNRLAEAILEMADLLIVHSEALEAATERIRELEAAYAEIMKRRVEQFVP